MTLVDPFAGHDDSDAGRVGGDLFSRDAPDGVLGFDIFELAEEAVAGSVDGLEFEV